jgi:hypothetical protein
MLWGHIDLDPRISYHSTFYQVQIAATWLTIVSIGLLFVGADLFRERLLRSMLVWSIVGVGMLALPFKLSSAHVPVLSIGGLFGMWFVAVAWSQALANQRLHDALRVVLGMAAVSWLVMSLTVERQWVSGWVPATVAFIAVSLAARPALGRVLLAVAVMLAPLYYAMIYHTLVVDQQAEGSIGGEFGRVEMWQRGLGVIGDHLVLGTGPGGYALYYVTFIPDQAMSTHSNLIDILAQQGIVGAALFAMLLAGLWRLGRRLSGTPELHADRALLAAARGGMAGVIVSLFFGDWLIPFIYNQTIAGFDHSVYSWLMLAALCGLAADESRSDTPHA